MIRRLVALGMLEAGCCLAILLLSRQFLFGEAHHERPLVAVLVLFAGAFLLYYLSVRAIGFRPYGMTTQEGNKPAATGVIVFGFALLFRIILLFSEPIQEVDLYRYLWDGRVLLSGVSPYRYAPAEIDGDRSESSAERLYTLRTSTPAIEVIHSRIHYPDVPTVYPPVSQLVFGAAAWLTPAVAPLPVHVIVLKSVIVLFDLGSMLLLWHLLAKVGYPREWAIVYGWCPLVLKEFANSGHLDAIAVFLLLSSVSWLVGPPFRSSRTFSALIASAAWALATLAKVYPVILLPLFARWWWRALRWRCLIPLALYGVILSGVYGWLMFGMRGDAAPRHPFEGLAAFLAGWEMNDLLFAVVVENLTPDATRENVEPWFALTPDSFRISVMTLIERWGNVLGVASPDPAFLVAQLLTGGLLLGILLWVTARAWDQDQRVDLLRRVFHTLAWLWMLSATQNPWYWSWALPFLVFVGRSWFWVSGLCLLYYARFWLLYHFEATTVLGTAYRGAEFFDYVVVWIEHLPIWCGLTIDSLRRGRRSSARRP